MTIEQLCTNCGSSFITEEPQKEYDEISKRWIEKQAEFCTDCIKDLNEQT